MNQKEKIYIALGFILVIGLIIVDFFLYGYYARLKNSPQSKINATQVYNDYVKGLQ